ncbi:hypothetical protein [Mesorhizobium sp. M0019]|uniref:hypothetical protein n=1 Tax=Mesorhizobium sp. M0019 TaxID=2956845 RepID=UPI00333A2427
MGDLPLESHWKWLVTPSVQNFVTSEELLRQINMEQDGELFRQVSYETLRLGMVGAIFLHHFAEVALERDAFARFNPTPTNKAQVRQLIANCAVDAAGNPRPDDHKVLGEAADAIKHAELTSPQIIHVPKTGRVIEIALTPPTIHLEGRPDGEAQVLIITNAGSRSLSAIMHNVVRGWNALLGLPLI